MPASETIHEATELVNGALRKVAMTQYHAHELAQVLEEREPFEIALQAHFEGVLTPTSRRRRS